VQVELSFGLFHLCSIAAVIPLQSRANVAAKNYVQCLFRMQCCVKTFNSYMFRNLWVVPLNICPGRSSNSN